MGGCRVQCSGSWSPKCQSNNERGSSRLIVSREFIILFYSSSRRTRYFLSSSSSFEKIYKYLMKDVCLSCSLSSGLVVGGKEIKKQSREFRVKQHTFSQCVCHWLISGMSSIPQTWCCWSLMSPVHALNPFLRGCGADEEKEEEVVDDDDQKLINCFTWLSLKFSFLGFGNAIRSFGSSHLHVSVKWRFSSSYSKKGEFLGNSTHKGSYFGPFNNSNSLITGLGTLTPGDTFFGGFLRCLRGEERRRRGSYCVGWMWNWSWQINKAVDSDIWSQRSRVSN